MEEDLEGLGVRREVRFLGFVGEEAHEAEREVRSVVFGAFVSHPICVVCRTLAQLGFNPLPLNKARYFIFTGPTCLFYPNFFSCARYLMHAYGYRSLWTGAQIALVRETLTCALRMVVTKQMELRYFGLGGGAEIARNGPRNVFQRFRLLLRFIVRSSICVLLLDFVSYPFILIQTREVAKVVCGSKLSGDIFDSFSSVCTSTSELSKLYTGMTPLLISSMISMFLTHTTSFCLDVVFFKMRDDEEANERHPLLRTILDVLSSFWRKAITYPYMLTSVITSMMGSNLPVRDLTYRSGVFRPKCSNWLEVHALLRASGNQWRGQYSFFRSYTGLYTMGFDGRYYVVPTLSL